MGLALLANLAAHDLGYLSVGGLIERTQATLATMQRLERHRGHFYNWYETRTLKPLLPLYVSSVDSGNLAGHLLTLAAGLREQADEKIFTPQIFAGLRDTVKVLQDLAARKPIARGTRCGTGSQRRPVCAPRLPCWKTRRGSPLKSRRRWRNEEQETSRWAEILKRDCEAHLEELRFLAPWLALPICSRREEALTGKRKAESGKSLSPSRRLPPSRNQFPQLDQARTLREVARLDQSLDPLIGRWHRRFRALPA
jgi:cyclic beta-1,2-glucan synthetase